MPGPGQVARGWDLDRIIKNFEQRINTLEKLARGSGTSAFLIDTPRWYSTLPANATITSGSFANIGFSTEGSAPEHDLGTPAFMQYITPGGEPRYQLDRDGLYYIKMSIQWNGTAGTGVRKGHIFENATATPVDSYEQASTSGNGLMESVHTIWPFLEGEYFRVGAFQNSGGNLDILAAGSGSATDPRAASHLTVVPIGAYAVA
jgi:hypothetical protein